MTTTKHWLGTAAIALVIGTGSGAAFAQNQPETKHEEGRPAASQHEMNRGETKGGGAAAERGASEAKQGAKEGRDSGKEGQGAAHEQAQSRESKPAAGQNAQQSTKGEHDQSAQRDREQREGREAKDKDAESRQKQGAAEERRNESKGENKNAAETNKNESNKAAQSGQQKQEQQADHRDRNPANATQQSQEERKGPASEQTAGKQQGSDRNNANQAQSRPNNTTTQQGAQTDPNQRNAAGQPQNNAAGQPQNNAAGQAQNNQTGRGSSRTSVSVNDQQRTRVFDQLRRDREFDQARSDVDIRVDVGERVPDRVRPRPLPSDIVSIVPEYRGYDYTVVHDEIAIIDPRSREIVDVIPQGGGSGDRYGGGYGGSYGGKRVTLNDEQRQILFRSATATSTVGTTSSSSGSSSSGPTCLSLKQVPDELAKSNPELASYQYLAIGDQVVLVDPQNQKIVQVIDQQQQSQQ